MFYAWGLIGTLNASANKTPPLFGAALPFLDRGQIVRGARRREGKRLTYASAWSLVYALAIFAHMQ